MKSIQKNRASVLLTAALMAGAASASAATYEKLQDFDYGTSGAYPNSPLTAVGGKAYGVFQGGFAYGGVYQVGTNGTYGSVGFFDSSLLGSSPSGPLLSANGQLYGVTQYGGTNGLGVFYGAYLNGGLTNYASFPGSSGLYYPIGSVVKDGAGNFYGVANSGGTNNSGGIFKVNAVTKAITSLHDFYYYDDGSSPSGGLTAGPDGALYGVCQYGGIYGNGTAYKITADGVFTKLHDFGNGGSVSYPYGDLALAADGNFYGIAYDYAVSTSVIFRLSPAGVYSVAHQFKKDGSEGYEVNSWLYPSVDGTLYGGTYSSQNGYGLLYQITTNGQFNVVFDSMSYATGQAFSGVVDGADGALYGATRYGGNFGYGTVFRLTGARFIQQPKSKSLLPGGTATFTASVYSLLPVTYQWVKDGETILPGETNLTLTVTNVQSGNLGSYKLVAFDGTYYSDSKAAELSFIASGKYNGLFFEAAGVNDNTSGFIQFKINPKFKASGKILLDGNPVGFSGGLFNSNGMATLTVKRAKFGKPDLTLSVEVADGQVVGTLGNSNWTANVLADFQYFSKTNLAEAYTGTYTVFLPGYHNYCRGCGRGESEGPYAPYNDGYALVKVTTNGMIKMVGTLPDGMKLAQSVPVSQDGQWPLFRQLYRSKELVVNSETHQAKLATVGHGSILGWLDFEDEGSHSNVSRGSLYYYAENTPSGEIAWTREAWTNAFYYPNGFFIQDEVGGSTYTRPEAGVPVLDFEDGFADFWLDDGNLPEENYNDGYYEYYSTVLLDGKNKLTVADASLKLKMSLTLKTGQWKGKFTPKYEGIPYAKPVKFVGAVNQYYNEALGVFIGNGEAGGVYLEEYND